MVVMVGTVGTGARGARGSPPWRSGEGTQAPRTTTVSLDSETPLVTDGLINNRDGIAGNFRPPANLPDELTLEESENMQRWAQERREQVVDFELHSRIGFSPRLRFRCNEDHDRLASGH